MKNNASKNQKMNVKLKNFTEFKILKNKNINLLNFTNNDKNTYKNIRPIPFGKPAILGRELQFISEVLESKQLSGDGPFSKRCEAWLQKELGVQHTFLTHSGTAALEMAAMLSKVGPGDEVIVPSFTFSSTATAFVLRGATPVFVDIRSDTLNIDEKKLENAITPRTRVVVPVHYAGHACEMDTILQLANAHDLLVIEDAAQAHQSFYKNRPLGTIGHMGCFSFHETKNIISGEGGALSINDPQFAERAAIIREKGTDRSRFFRGEIDKYTWQDIGSSYCPGEVISAFLMAQFEYADQVTKRRRELYELYQMGLMGLDKKGHITISKAEGFTVNGHMFWLLVEAEPVRNSLIAHLNNNAIKSVFHYVPLHSSPAGRHYGRTSEETLPVTDSVSTRLLRLPLYFGLENDEVERIVDSIYRFFE